MSYKSEGTAWLLWAGCFCGCCGLHRCYLNRIGTGVVWWVTGGLCGIGQCLDTCAISSMVAQENIKLTPAVIVKQGPPQVVVVSTAPAPAPVTPLVVQAQPGYGTAQPGYAPQPAGYPPAYVPQAGYPPPSAPGYS